MSDDSAVRVSIERDVALITLDDGKANALSHSLLAALDAALVQAESSAGALAFVGRPGRFCAGFDLTAMNAGPSAARDLVRAGAEIALRLFDSKLPVVIGCTGHALAMGAIFLNSADHRIGATGSFKIGMNEVAIGLPVPVFAVELAAARLSPRYLTAATCLARVFDPVTAVDAGYLDELVPADQVIDAAVAKAEELSVLSRGALARTRHNLRGDTIARIRASLDTDLADFGFDSGTPA